jgi:hypothetical protein
MEVATMKRAILWGLLGWLALTLASPLVAQPFTYQGFLKQNGQPVNGTTSLTFRLYDAPTGGTQIGSAITQTVNVQNGLFTVQLDFGAVWTGGDRYLEISVGSTTLAPRVKITPTPYAAFAASAGFAQRPWQSAGSNIFYNDGNVGIGTSSPAARLSLGGGDANTKLAIWQGANASQVMGLGVGPAQFRLHLNNSSDRFSFLNAPNGSEVMTVRGDGNVGIGTWNPWYRLHVEGDGYFSGRMILGDGTPVGRLYVTGDSQYLLYALNYSNGDSTAVMGIVNTPSAIGWGVFGETRSNSISSAGVYGLATSSTGNTKGVWGRSLSPDGTGVRGEATASSGANSGVFGVSLSASGRGVYGGAYATSGTNFGVYGESLSPDGRAVYGLARATTGWNFGVAGESRSPSGLGGWFGSAGKKGARVVGQGYIFREDWPSNWQGGLETWDIVCAGIRYDALEARSDIRLKRDIQSLDASSELQRLLSLRPVSYYWRDERLPQTLQYGFIAQELQQVFPELVSEGEDAQKTLAVNYQALIPLLVNALQVQQEQIRQQEARIQKLEAELQRLQRTSPK